MSLQWFIVECRITTELFTWTTPNVVFAVLSEHYSHNNLFLMACSMWLMCWGLRIGHVHLLDHSSQSCRKMLWAQSHEEWVYVLSTTWNRVNEHLESNIQHERCSGSTVFEVHVNAQDYSWVQINPTQCSTLWMIITTKLLALRSFNGYQLVGDLSYVKCSALGALLRWLGRRFNVESLITVRVDYPAMIQVKIQWWIVMS